MTVKRRYTKAVPATSPTIEMYEVRDTSPDRTLVYRASDDTWLGTFTDGCRTVHVRGVDTRTLEEQISFAAAVEDDFNRTNASAWGNTDAGGRWTVRSGSSSDFNVTPGYGLMSLGSVNSSRRIAPSSYGYDYSWSDTTATVKASAAALGDSIYACIMSSYNDISNHYLATLEFSPNHSMVETFGSTVASGWGTEDTHGFSWSTSGGSASDYSVVGGSYGVHSLGSLNVSRRTIVDSVDETDGEVLMSVTHPTQPTGGSLYSGALLRYTDADNHYIVRLRKNYTGDATVAQLSLQKQVATVNTTLVTYDLTGVTIPVDEKWWIRARIDGTSIKARTWKDGTSEPGSWQIDTTDSSLTTGTKWGVRSIASTALSNALPITVRFPSWQFSTLTTGDRVGLHLQKRVAGTTSNLVGDFTYYDLTASLGTRRGLTDEFRLRSYREETTGELSASAWKVGDAEPVSWQTTITDEYSLGTGDIGLRGTLQPSYTGTLPCVLSWSSYAVDARWSNPTTVSPKYHRSDLPSGEANTLVYVLPAAFDGTVDRQWLTSVLLHRPQDLMMQCMEYLANAPVTTVRTNFPVNRQHPPVIVLPSGERLSGDSNYGPRDTAGDGSRIEGSDYNDYLGLDIDYPSFSEPGTYFTDTNEVEQLHSLDCSGFVRTIFGFRNDMPMQLTAHWSDRLPRISSELGQDGWATGTVVWSDTSRPSVATLVAMDLQPGDLLFFDADTSNPDEEEGQIDHIGIYLGHVVNPSYNGTSVDHFRYFISSRKTANGPTFSNVGGVSRIDGTGLYATTLRKVRRY